MSLKEDLIYAKKIINGARVPHFARLYPFTTENLKGYLSNYDFNGKHVLTIGSSSDQIINSYLRGASLVHSFDINIFVNYYFDLKKAGILALELNDFYEFFCFKGYPYFFKNNKHAFNNNVYESLRHYLNGDSLIFWDDLFSNYKGIKIRKKLFNDDEYSYIYMRELNSYLYVDNYNKLKTHINSFTPKFYRTDFRDLSKVLKYNYDYILLSNMANYIERMYEEPLLSFKNDIDKLYPFLNNDGIIFLAYLFNTDKYTKPKFYWDYIYHLNSVFRVFKDYNLSIQTFKSVDEIIYNDYSFRDSVLVLKK